MGKKIRTETIHYGVDPDVHYGSINDPIYKNSTLVFQNYKSSLKKIEITKTYDLLGYSVFSYTSLKNNSSYSEKFNKLIIKNRY